MQFGLQAMRTHVFFEMLASEISLCIGLSLLIAKGPVSNVAWDETITNTNTRYYNVAGYATAGNIYYGDHGTALQLIAQEIAA